MAAPEIVLHPGDDEDLLLSGASVARTGAYLNAATVTYAITETSLTTGAVTTVASGSMSLVSGSTTGGYEAVIESTVTSGLSYRGHYDYTITLVSGSYNKVWTNRVRVQPPA